MDTNLKKYKKYFANVEQMNYEKNRKNSKRTLKLIEAFDFINFTEKEIIVNTRSEFGHWEIDTIVGTRNKSAVLLSLDERLSRKRHLVKIEGRDTISVKKGLEKILSLYKKEDIGKIFKTITSDNGSEFYELSKIVKETKIYYAHPNASWEKGTNEKQNSLVRKFIPKGKSLKNITDEQVAYIEDWINLLPRKILNYSNPKEIFSMFI